VGVKKRIVVLPGDGIGPEVVDAAAGVLRAVAAQAGHLFSLESRPIGGAAVHQSGTSLPESTLDACRSADAVLLGAVGDPAFDGAPRLQSPEYALLTLRNCGRGSRTPVRSRPAGWPARISASSAN
jgi:3-isopropylmalate dehydrogenase